MFSDFSGPVNTSKCPHPSCVWSISEYSSEELETHREGIKSVLTLLIQILCLLIFRGTQYIGIGQYDWIA